MESDNFGREMQQLDGHRAGDLEEEATPDLDDDARLPRFLTAKEAAGWLRVSVWAIYDAVNAQTLPAVRVGRSIRIPRDALVADDEAHGPKAS